RPDPFGGVDGALLQRRIDVAAGDLLRDDAEFPQRLARPAADAHFKTFQVCWFLEFFVEPAAHLTAGIASRQTVHIEFLPEVIDQLRALAIVVPGVLLACVKAEWSSAEKCPGRILADKIIHGGMAHLDCTVLYRVEHLQRWHNFACGKALNLELAVGRLRNVFGDCFTSAINRIERFRPACRQTPFDRRAGLRDHWLRDGGGGSGSANGREKFTAFHRYPPMNSVLSPALASVCFW